MAGNKANPDQLHCLQSILSTGRFPSQLPSIWGFRFWHFRKAYFKLKWP